MKLKLFVILLCIPLLTGCWDKKELNDLAIVLASGLDKDRSTQEIIYTSQIVRPEALGENKSSYQALPTEIITDRGKSIFDARKNISKKLDRLPYLSHNRIIIISEYLAKDGLQPILDRLVRSNEIRPLDWIIIAKGASPEEIMTIEHGLSDIQAVYLNDIIKLRKQHSEANVNYLQQFVEDILGNVNTSTTGVMEVIKNPSRSQGYSKSSSPKEVKLTGTAVFQKDKLAGYLDDKETRGLNWLTNKIYYGTMIVPSPMEDNKQITIRIKKSTCKITPEKKDGDVTFNIEVKTSGELEEQQGSIDTSKPDVIELIARNQAEVIKKEIKTTIDKAQNNLKVDILGFGNAFNRKYPKEWKEKKDTWKDEFPNIKYTVKVDTNIVRTGLLTEPIKIK